MKIRLKNHLSDVAKKARDTVSVQQKDENLFISVNCPVSFTIKDTKNNRKALYVLLRLFKTENGKNLTTFEKISALFNLNSRQDSNNYYREYLASGEDLLHFLQRKQKLKEAFSLIEMQVLKNPLLSLKEHYKVFVDDNPIIKISEPSFMKYASEIDAIKLKKRFDQLLTQGEIKPDKERFLKELIEDDNISNQKRKEIVAVFPELQQDEKEVSKEISLFNNLDKFGKNFLIMFLVACGLNYQVLGMLMGVSKGTIHNLFYSLTFIKRLILNSIKWWSGEVSTDEKWIKLDKKWVYVISIVDNKTGFPLYFQLVSDLTSATWKIFFQRFYKIYGNPRLIISDGSGAIANAIKEVFPNSNHQLCKFHKLKNLMDRIYKSYSSPKEKKRMIKLAKGIFANKSYHGRKRAAKHLMEISPKYISKYVETGILGKWSQLTKGYTSNSAERWNRKIEKVTLGRYGLKSEKFIVQLITSLWLKEAINNKVHFEHCFINELDIKKICQENLKMCNIIEFFRNKLLGRVA